MSTKQVAAPSGKKRKLVNVHLLNGDEQVVHVDVKSKFQEVFNQIAGHLSLRETEYFGLAFKKDNEYHFIVLDEKIHKLAPKQWKSGPGEGLDSQGKALINVWFRVQFYVDQVILLREKVTRHQYYLQLKENVLQYNHLYNEEKCFQLAAYALQADHGNFVKEKHESGYFNPSLYFPLWMLERHGVDYLAENMPTIHRDLHNMTRNDAELRYIKNASMPPGAHNLHFYTVRKRKTDKACNTWLAICAKGVEVYEDDAGYKNHISTFMWKDIGKLYFDKKKFEIRSVQSAGGRRFMYYTDCDIKSKYLLSICRGTHMFQMAIQPKLLEIQHLDNEDQKRYRESYIYSDVRDRSHFQHSPSKSLSAAGSSSNQRFSVISDASSNTTSGIVSDRMAVSFDDGDDHAREIMIDCPPRSAVSGTPSQMRSKFQLLSSFKQSPQSSKTSPSQIPHTLELCKMEGVNASPQELSPTSSNGSWRARHSQTPACLMGATGLPLPSPTTPTQESKPYSGVRRSVGRKDSFSKLLQGSLLMTAGDRNTSGDSAVSVSGIFSGSDKFAPLSLPPSEHRSLPGSSGQSGASGLSGSGKSGRSSAGSNFSLTPPLTLSHLKKTPGPSPPTSLSFSSSSTSKDSSPRGLTSAGRDLGDHYIPLEMSQQYKTLNSPRELSEKLSSLNSPRANFPEQYGKPLGSPRNVSDPQQQQFKPLKSPQDLSKTFKPLGSPRDIKGEQFKLPSTPRGLHEYQPALNSPRTEAGFSGHTGAVTQSGQRAHTSLPDMPSTAVKPILDTQIMKDNHQLVTAMVHQSAEEHHATHSLPIQQVPRSATEHYLLALQQGSAHLIEQQPSSPRGGGMQMADMQPSQSGMVHLEDQFQQMQIQPVQQQQQQQHHHQQLLQQQHQNQQLLQQQQQNQQLLQQQQQNHQQLLQQQQQNHQQLQHGYYPYSITTKEIQMLPNQPQAQAADADSVREMEENKENLYHKEENEDEEEKDQVDINVQQSHNSKGNLHPELKQILGQSHAFSLPLITALCNDSSLMQSSRSHSGSRSSYDTSTVRSTDSRLTRFSHDTDSRRWSSCCQAAGMPEVMMSVQSARPYSWHSEHFELDSQLALPPTDHLPPTSPPNPRAVNNKHLKILDNQSSLPQKMIESDPGPSSPRMLTHCDGGSWWDSHSNVVAADVTSSSWTNMIPYSFPAHHLPSKHTGGIIGGSQQLLQHQHHQHMVPHKLSSGGHRDSDTSIAHKQIMKENIGIA